MISLFGKKNNEETSKGLLTPNKLQIKLLKNLIENVDDILNTRLAKIEIENHLLEKELTLEINNHTNLMLKIIYQKKDIKLFDEIIKNWFKIEKIIKTIEKIKTNQDVENLISFYKNINKKETLKKIRQCQKLEIIALKAKNYKEYMKYYQREKIYTYEILEELKRFEIGQISEEIVRSGFEPKNINFSRIVEILKLIYSSRGTELKKIIENTNKNNSLKNNLKIIMKEIFEGQNSAQTYAMQIQDKSRLNNETIIKGVKVSGTYTKEDLDNVKKCLNKYRKEELKRFLKEIIFFKNESEEYGIEGKYSGHYMSDMKKIRIYGKCFISTLEHEIAHARDEGFPKELRNLFDKINRNFGINRDKIKNKLKYTDISGFQWKDKFYEEIKYGYSRAYGVVNIVEDIATMQELITDSQYEIETPKYEEFKMYLQVYEKKAELMFRFGFITKKQLQDFIKFLYSTN